jgi:hypothetical protein
MKTTQVNDKKKKENIIPSKNNRSQVDNLHNTIFKPPKYGTEFFYYTEVYSDWVDKN